MRDNKKDLKVETESTRFVISDSGTPWEIGPGFLKMVGAPEPQDADSRARLTGTVLKDAEEVSKEEALEAWEELKARLRSEKRPDNEQRKQ